MNDLGGPKRLVFWALADGFTVRKLNPQPKMVSDLLHCFDDGQRRNAIVVQKVIVKPKSWPGNGGPCRMGAGRPRWRTR